VDTEKLEHLHATSQQYAYVVERQRYDRERAQAGLDPQCTDAPSLPTSDANPYGEYKLQTDS